jgi:hypothetical protein
LQSLKLEYSIYDFDLFAEWEIVEFLA